MTTAPEQEDPPWGSLPVEQFLVQHWDSSSPLTPTEQRSQLVGAFLQSETIPTDTLRIPTAEEIRTVLEPYRPAKLRRIAHQHVLHASSYDGFYFLRTYYDGGADDDAKLQKWFEDFLWHFYSPWRDASSSGDSGDEDDDEIGASRNTWWIILDDPELFDVGDAWPRVYNTLPELVKPVNTRPFEPMAEQLKLKDELTRSYGYKPRSEDVFNRMLRMACNGSNRSPIILLDKQAFSTGNWGLVYLDSKGDVVKKSQTHPDSLDYLHIGQEIELIVRKAWWDEGVLGDKYKNIQLLE
ncbi:hypothetical protein EMPG_11646 [Blastomyces silverae]|uniref:Uncharacterized protein n=1 Tax=Blastomyces silverae TaxID=2060906 RepID=A0A0H1BQ15_9EURO|nr:hypothetical protein EMPG_11646 [Blastomyces silverae]